MKSQVTPRVGVLALQGDFEQHVRQLTELQVDCRLVKLPSDLLQVDALVLPGGESTTMDKLIDRFGLREPLTKFCRTKPVYGTCAGMILLAKNIVNNQANVKPLDCIDIDVIRNGWGRQIFSFEDELTITLNNQKYSVPAEFIRAPKIAHVGKGVEVLGTYRNEVVAVQAGNVLAVSFHNELTQDFTLLRYFSYDFCLRTPIPDVY